MRLVICSLAILAATATNAGATSVSYPDFSDVTNLTLNGSAHVQTTGDGQILRLVNATAGQSGSAFNSVQINANDFSTTFQFRLTNRGGISDGSGIQGADGFVFVIQNVSANIGGSGGGLGYSGVTSSVGIEFDTFWNGGNPINDPSSNHVGLDINGNVQSVATVNVAPDFDNGQLWTAWIDYNGTTDTLEVRTTQGTVRPVTSTLTYTGLDIAGIIGTSTAYVGFTAGTGAAWANHDILNWAYSDSFVEGGVEAANVPEPASLLLLGTGIATLARRFRRKATV